MVRRVLIVVAVLCALGFLRNVTAAGLEADDPGACDPKSVSSALEKSAGSSERSEVEDCLTDQFWYFLFEDWGGSGGDGKSNPKSLFEGFVYWWES